MDETFEKNQLISDSESSDESSDSESSANEEEKEEINESSSIPTSKYSSTVNSSIEDDNSDEEDEKILNNTNNNSIGLIEDSSNDSKNLNLENGNKNSSDEKIVDITEDSSESEDSFKDFLEDKKIEHFTSSPYETIPAKVKGVEKDIIHNESKISQNGKNLSLSQKPNYNQSNGIIEPESYISASSEIEIIDDSYCQLQIQKKSQIIGADSESGDSEKKEGNSICIIESSESDIASENSDINSVNNDGSLQSFPSVSDGSVFSEKSLSQSMSNCSQNSYQRNTSGSETERTILERQIRNKTAVYQNLMRAIRSCDASKLKDGGKLLLEKQEKCKEELRELREKLKILTDAESDQDSLDVIHVPQEPNQIFSTKDQITANLGKKGMETHRIQSALTIDALVTLHDSLKTCPTPDTLEDDPSGLKVELMPHQKYALAWLLWREKQAPCGGILADDMGLGKTLTMIALVLRSEEIKKELEIEDEREVEIDADGIRTYPGKTLVVCPASLVGQWEGQIKQHCKRNLLTVLVHHGKPRELQAKRLAQHDIVITTYGVIAEEHKTIEGKDRKGALFRVRWERVILDEAHVIRNHKTKKAVALCEIDSQYRWCLTGTPVHNKELDMYSLLKFLHCAPFDDLMVWKKWVDNKSPNGVQRLNTVVKSILLRRTKEDLKNIGELSDLPPKEIQSIYIDLDEEELKVYHEVLQFSKTLLSQYIYQKEEKAGFLQERLSKIQNNLKRIDNIKTSEIFVLLLRLRQICCLPGLIHSMLEDESCAEDGIEAEEPVIEDLLTQVNRLSISGRPSAREETEERRIEKILITSNPVFRMERPSKKIQTVLDILDDVLKTNDKIVIVSQWATLLKHLEIHIRKLKIGIVTLDGSVPVKLRSKIVEDFNNSKSNVRLILLSLNAGGVGLNLIGGNRLIIFEPHWNPQLESQACDRIYRVGQKKPVQVYKIICKDTIEERIEQLQRKKLELANNVLKGELKTQVTKLSLQDLMVLFDLKKSS